MRLSLPRIKFGQVIERIKGSKSNKIKKLEEKDFSLFQSMSLLAEGLNKPPLAYHHPIRSFSQSLKGHLLKYQSSTTIEVDIL